MYLGDLGANELGVGVPPPGPNGQWGPFDTVFGVMRTRINPQTGRKEFYVQGAATSLYIGSPITKGTLHFDVNWVNAHRIGTVQKAVYDFNKARAASTSGTGQNR